jgi:2-polyprenyl-3-methyl-5-hydroxy-6-metoxy-1,4-benzoquinol methylase
MDLDRIAKDYHLAPQDDMFIENICQEFELEWVRSKITPNSKVLELGYGDGITFRNLAKYCQLSTVDGSKLIIEEARKVNIEIGGGAKIYESYFEDFEPKELYDYVFASHVLEHVSNPMLIVKKFNAWLRPNGKAIIIVPNSQSIHRRLATLMGIQSQLDSLSPRDHLVGHLRVFNSSELETLLNENGWDVLERRGFFLKTLANSQMVNFETNLVRAMCKISDELPPELCANIAIIVTRREE